MRAYSRLLVFISFTMFFFGGQAMTAKPPFDVKDVRQVRHWLRLMPDDHWRKEYRYLLHNGEEIFPAYEAILSDPKSPAAGGVFDILRDTEADRRCFLKYAVARLTDENSFVRGCAADLLERIGSPSEASSLVALLSDEDSYVARAAARALGDIGGTNELVAMDVWLRGISHRDKPRFRHYVQECRAKLKKRLDEAKDPKKRAQTIHECWRNLTITEWEGKFVVQRAVWQLTAFETETVAFLKVHLRPVPPASQKCLDQLVADLDSDSFERREAVTRELTRGIVAESVLEKELANRLSLEQRRRLKAILEDLPAWRTKNPELLQQVRGVWVLQQIGTPEAKALLEKLAAGAPSARLTQKAKDALESLKKR